MTGEFEATADGGAAVALDEVEISILRSLAVQLMELIGPGDEPAQGSDPLAALLAEGPTKPPGDPVLARFFPDAYGDPAAEPANSAHAAELRAASSEFRKFTEMDLRARKRQDALAVVRALDELTPGRGGGAVLRLDADSSRHWLGALNDLRLAIGTRLGVTDDEDGGGLYTLPDSDSRKPMVMAYLWLGALQESLVETLLD